MGILYAGEKRSKDFEGKTKKLHVFRIGWKRILKNTERFGWAFLNDNDLEEIHYNPNTGKKSKFTVWLEFVRIDKLVKVCPGLGVIEFFYNVFFLLRRLFAMLVPAFLIVLAVSFLLPQNFVEAGVILLVISFCAWLMCIIGETVLARAASAKFGLDKNDAAGQSHNEGDYSKSGPLSEDDIIILQDAKGNDIKMMELAGIKYCGKYYAILQPVELLEGMKDNEALVFRVFKGSNGESKFEVELDEKIIDAVFLEYNRLLDEAEGIK